MHSRAAVSIETKWLLCSTRFFAFVSSLKLSRRLLYSVRFNIQPPARKSICLWNHQFEQIGWLCKGKSSGRPRVSEENVRRIQESFESGPRKSTRRASRELWIPHPTVWFVLRRRLLLNSIFLNHPVHIYLLFQDLDNIFERCHPVVYYQICIIYYAQSISIILHMYIVYLRCIIYYTNLILHNGMASLKFVAIQACSIHQYKNLKIKLLKYCADIFFNRQSLTTKIVPNYTNCTLCIDGA